MLQAEAGSSEEEGGRARDEGAAGGQGRKKVPAARKAPPPPKPTLRSFLKKLQESNDDDRFTLQQEGPPLFTQMLFPTAGSEGYKGVLDGLRPIEEEPWFETKDGAHSLQARLLEQMRTEQDAVKKLDASLGQRLMKLADLYRCVKCVTVDTYATGYGQVLIEDQIGQEPQRVARLPVDSDPTDRQSSPFFLVLRAANGGYVSVEIEPEDYARLKAAVAFEACAGTAATSAEDAPKAAKDTNVAAPPKAAEGAEQPKKRKGPLHTKTRTQNDGELDHRAQAHEARKQDAAKIAAAEAVVIEDDEDDDFSDGSENNDKGAGSNNEEEEDGDESSNEGSSDESSSDSCDSFEKTTGSASRPAKPRAAPRQDAPTKLRAPNTYLDLAETLAVESPGNKVMESPKNAAKPKTLVLPLINLAPSKSALLAHMDELLKALAADCPHPYGLFNKDHKRTADLYAVGGPARSRARARSYSPRDRQLWCRLLSCGQVACEPSCTTNDQAPPRRRLTATLRLRKQRSQRRWRRTMCHRTRPCWKSLSAITY